MTTKRFIAPILKTILAATFLLFVLNSACAQYGQVYFDSLLGGGVVDGTTMPPMPASSFKITLYSGSSPGLLTAATTTTGSSGSYNAGLVSLPPYTPFSYVYLQAKAWAPTTYTSYEAAVASGDPSVRVGVSSTSYTQLGTGASSPHTAFGAITLSTIAAPVGSLQVMIGPPEAVSAGAQWKVDGGIWRSSGTTVSGLSVGSHTVSFSTISGWTTPTDQNVTISGGQTATATGDYVAALPGSLQVNILPAGAVSAGAQWRVGDGSWQNSGDSVTNLIAGSHTISYSAVSGWLSPGNQAIRIDTGTANSLQGEYQMAFPLNATYSAATNVPATASTYTAAGNTVNLTLNYSPATGTELMVVNNTGLDFISGEFSNLTNGQSVTLSYGGSTYKFVVNYYGGTGNDLVLVWANNQAYSWGENYWGQIGDGTTTTSDPWGKLAPLAVSTTPGLSALNGKTLLRSAAGDGHSLALCSDGTLAAWGKNYQGQLGDGTTTPRLVPTAVNRSPGSALSGRTVVAIAAGGGIIGNESYSLALCSDGSVAAWGPNGEGQLGDGTRMERRVPVAVNVEPTSALYGKMVVAIAAGAHHSLALCSDGSVIGWGFNSRGQLGDNTTTDRLVPVAVNTSPLSALYGKRVVAIAAGGEYSLALCSDGSVAAWGNNGYGQLGDNTTTERHLPVAVSTALGVSAISGKTVKAISAGAWHSLALCADGTVATWGYNTTGQLGDNTTTHRLVPVAVNTSPVSALYGKSVVAIAAGREHSLALCSDGSVATWGRNNVGQLGDNTATNRLVPVVVDSTSLPLGARFAGVTSGAYARHTVAVVSGPTKSPATVILANLSQTYDGTAKSVSVTTSPPGLAANVTYNGSVNAPTNVGNYAVIGNITDPNYLGSATNTLAIVIPDNSTNVIAAQSVTLPSGQSATASTAPTSAGQAGVTATATNGGGTSNLMVVVANYATQPAGVPVFQAGASYVDIRVWGADNNDSLSANFYYPSSITGSAEANLALAYWNGANWNAVRNSGGSFPAKDTTDNLAGTVSGGRFTVAFGMDSTPTLMGLTGTVFALGSVVVATSPPQLSVSATQSNGTFRFEFASTPGAAFTVFCTTNLSVPFSNWPALGGVTETSPGQFQFTDSQAANSPQRFYRVRSP